MEDKSCARSKSPNRDDSGDGIAVKHLEGEPLLGDVIWVKLHGDTWWPAVVVGRNVSGNNQTGERVVGDVHVRLYGSYEYMYVDPIQWRSEFQITLEQNNGSYEEILRKALERDLSSSKSGQVKRKGAKSKDGEKAISKASKTKEHDRLQKRLKQKRQDGKEKHESNRNSPRTAEGVKGRSSKQDEVLKKQKLNTPSSDAALSGRSQELSARRTKVMQTLGLIAPSGSPFHKMDRFI